MGAFSGLGAEENYDRSFLGELLLEAIDKLGEAMFLTRVCEAVRAGYAAVDDILEFAVFDRIPNRTPNMVRVRLARDKRSLRVDVPDLDQLLPHLSRLEEFMTRLFVAFAANLGSNKAAAAESARRRFRTDTPTPKVGGRKRFAWPITVR
ncbi:hypothetical protein ACFSHT_19730 [Paraburkholderia silviterrae]|uniref:hypothetical protein n=1 Tax=Paraburkholderia silviterrae TaxID=2528715 RepID=UPI00196BA6D6|nr:hypothetical protein [Paraburkholderia silviterrae]